MNVSIPSEHPPGRGKMSKCLGAILDCEDKTSSRHLNGFPDNINIGSTVVAYFCTMCGLEKLGIVDQNWLEHICPICC